MIRLSGEQGAVLMGAMEGLTDHRVQEIFDCIREQILNPQHSEDLIELVATVLSSHMTSISGSYLQTLREAILNPRELAKAQAMTTTWKSCHKCHRELSDGEMITVHQQMMYCSLCTTPTVLSCASRHYMKFPDGVKRVLQKSLSSCEQCQQKPAEKPTVDAYDDAPRDVPREVWFTSTSPLSASPTRPANPNVPPPTRNRPQHRSWEAILNERYTMDAQAAQIIPTVIYAPGNNDDPR